MKIRWNLKEEYEKLTSFLEEEYSTYTIYPPKKQILNALTLPIEEVKVVILGQDPYHGPNQANGLAFAVSNGIKRPPSLQNIFKELSSDLQITPSSPSLEGWKRQGVLLLNTALTVREGAPLSHKDKWESFTDKVLLELNGRRNPIVFLLWGSKAIHKGRLITNTSHHILTAAHPSPLSAYNGFFGCKHFSKTNQILDSILVKTIDWSQTD